MADVDHQIALCAAVRHDARGICCGSLDTDQRQVSGGPVLVLEVYDQNGVSTWEVLFRLVVACTQNRRRAMLRPLAKSTESEARSTMRTEIGILLYPGVQMSAVLGLTDLFGVADGIGGQSPAVPRLCVRHLSVTDGVSREISTRAMGPSAATATTC